MTLAASYTLQDVIEEALLKTDNGGTRAVIHYLQLHHRRVLDDNSLTIESIGLGSMIRAFRKKRPTKDTYTKIKNLCLDFGLEYMDLDDEISVPLNLDNILNCECDWPDLDDASIDDLDKHLLLRDAQQIAHQASPDGMRAASTASRRASRSRAH